MFQLPSFRKIAIIRLVTRTIIEALPVEQNATPISAGPIPILHVMDSSQCVIVEGRCCAINRDRSKSRLFWNRLCDMAVLSVSQRDSRALVCI
jgi:hypothetical protein